MARDRRQGPALEAKVVLFRLGYDDGTVMEARGEDAERIWRYYESCVVSMLLRSAAKYPGPFMTKVRGPRGRKKRKAKPAWPGREPRPMGQEWWEWPE
jgi:hypothetical protein